MAMELDPGKLYAELKLGTNIVSRVFPGKSIPEWASKGRRIIEVPQGVTVLVGYRYHKGTFSPAPSALPVLSGIREKERDLARLERLVDKLPFDHEDKELFELILKLLRRNY